MRANNGYWEERGRERTGEICAVTRSRTQTETESGLLPGGLPSNGFDGVDRVEISLGGDTWTETEAADPLSGGDTWRQWRYEMTEHGDHGVVVRLHDRRGTGERGRWLSPGGCDRVGEPDNQRTVAQEL